MEHGEEQQNYWPGFVDALSNVVLTLVFVLVVIVFALVISSSKVEQKAIELLKESTERHKQKVMAEEEMMDLRKELRDVMKALQEAQALIAKLKRENEELKAKLNDQPHEQKSQSQARIKITVDAKPKKAAVEDSEIDASAGVIVIYFPIGVFELNDKAKEDLLKELEPLRAKLAGTSPNVRSVQGAESYSEGRRLAYFRGLSVRNFLIDKGFGTGKSINVKLDQEPDVADGRVEISFRRR